jgi:tRNA1(Val) A37 N6-methylase TrmN6
MIDISNLPLFSKVILIIGFTMGIVSLVLVMRYPIILILMKLSPEYRKFIKKTLAHSKLKQKSRF